MSKGLVIGLTAVGLALGGALWAANPPRAGKVGAPSKTGETAVSDTTPTFYKDVLPIVQVHCQSCHRPGQIGPFSLLDYQSARPWAKAIKGAVAKRVMPPWFANPEFGHFTNDRSLSQAQIATLVAWADNGAPAGNPTDALKPVQWPEGGWSFKPDVAVDLPPFPVPAAGILDWEHLVVPAPFKEDTWVTSVEILPGDPAVVHHICIQLETHQPTTPYNLYEWVEVPRDAAGHVIASSDHGDFRKTEGTVISRQVGSTEYTRRQGKPLIPGNIGEFCYVPGSGAFDFRPLHAGFFVPAGSDLFVGLHYTTNGAAATDQTRIGFTVSKTPPTKKIISQFGNGGNEVEDSQQADSQKIAIPPYDADYLAPPTVFTFTKDTELVWAQPHMHVRGKSARYTLIHPDGKEEVILDVPNYDFNWQLMYMTELKIPKGSKLRVDFRYDNSTGNRYNPDPSSWVYYGQQSWEEMGSSYVSFLMDQKENANDVVKSSEDNVTKSKPKTSDDDGSE